MAARRGAPGLAVAGVVALVVAGLAACGSDPERVPLPVLDQGGAYPDLPISGRIELADDGCVFLRSADDPSITGVVWPPGTTRHDQTGVVVLPGGERIEDGDVVRAAGATRPRPAGGWPATLAVGLREVFEDCDYEVFVAPGPDLVVLPRGTASAARTVLGTWARPTA